MRRKREKRKRFKKKTTETGILRKETSQYWSELKEKSKQLRYREDSTEINRKQGEKRKRTQVKREELERKLVEKSRKSLKEKENSNKRGVERHSKSNMDLKLTRVKARPSEKLELSNKQILKSNNDEQIQRPAAAKREGSIYNYMVLGTPGIRSKHGFTQVSRPVKVNGKVKINDNYKTGAKASREKLSPGDKLIQRSNSLIQTKISRFLEIGKPGPHKTLS